MRNRNDQLRTKLKVGLILGSFTIVATILLIDLADNVLDGLSFLALVGFVWLAFVEKKVTVAVILMTAYIVLAIFLMSQGLMHEHVVRSLTTLTILIFVIVAVFQSKFLNIFIAIGLLWGGALILYLYDSFETIISIGGLFVGGLGIFLSYLLLHRKNLKFD